ncbi:YkoP family protein [Niallia sp. 01092]|uniref:YkoP family protein n=1 Tax=unclassified Niallia TaxID=2837522 RepID=UPI003FD3680B
MRGYLLSIWSILDPIYYKCSRLTYLPKTGSDRNIFRVRLTKYKGKNIILSDGTNIKKNDLLIKIHLHNVKLLKELKNTKSELKKAKIIFRSVQHSLPGIELYIRNHKKSQQIKGIIGITNLNKSCDRLGFEVVHFTNRIYKWFKWTSSLPITLLSRNSPFKNNIFKYQPSYLLMSKHKLSSLYRK